MSLIGTLRPADRLRQCLLVGYTGSDQRTVKPTRLTQLIPAPEQHESAYLLRENAVAGGVVFGI